ncbi:MAG: DUF167 domain-containing protein [Rubrivivax sp.]|nr:DUF167 domain-containing protein [Rubrivivax sp.]
MNAAAAAPSARWPCLAAHDGGTLLQLAVVPGARRNGADGLHDGALRLRLVAPPVEGQANAALQAWLAAELQLPRRGVRLLRGETSRRKQVWLDLAPAAVGHWLDGVLREAADRA